MLIGQGTLGLKARSRSSSNRVNSLGLVVTITGGGGMELVAPVDEILGRLKRDEVYRMLELTRRAKGEDSRQTIPTEGASKKGLAREESQRLARHPDKEDRLAQHI